MIISSIKGRIRIEDAILRNREKADLIQEKLEKLDGITYIRITQLIGSLLVTYDESKISKTEILDNLEELVNIEAAEMDGGNGSDKKLLKVFFKNMDEYSKEKGQGRGRRNNCRQGSSLKDSLISFTLENINVSNIIKTTLFGFIGVQCYKKRMRGK